MNPPTKKATWHEAKMAEQLYAACETKRAKTKPVNANSYDGAFEQNWQGIDVLRNDLGDRLSKGNCSHKLVVVMGWNTPQGNAVQNFNSILSHLLDETEAQRKIEGVHRK